MRHSLICVYPDGTIEGVVSLTDIFSFLLNSSAPAAESRIAALKKDYAQFEAAEAEALQHATEAAGVTPTIVGEEMLKQRNFLAEHGQAQRADSTPGELTLHDAAADMDMEPTHYTQQHVDTTAANDHSRLSATGFQQQTPLGPASASPAIRPAALSNSVPRDMDYLE